MIYLILGVFLFSVFFYISTVFSDLDKKQRCKYNNIHLAPEISYINTVIDRMYHKISDLDDEVISLRTKLMFAEGDIRRLRHIVGDDD